MCRSHYPRGVTLAGTDLNLLVALKALLEEVNVTRAGERLGMTQPSMSGALAKLRRRFDDELLTRSGRDYELTQLGRELLPDVQVAVQRMSRALAVEEPFDPATSHRAFRALMSDYAVAVLHEPLIDLIGRQAPHVRMEIFPMPTDAHDERHLHEHDVMIAPLGFGFAGCSKRLWSDRMVCLVDQANPWRRDEGLTLDALREMPHAVTSLGSGIVTPVARVLGELDIQPRVQLQVAGWLPLPFVIRGTDMVAIVPERLARLHVLRGSGLTQVEPPFGEVALVEGYWFASSRVDDQAHRWLVARLNEVADRLEVTTSRS